MRLSFVLFGFALLLAMSSLTSYVGYRYLSLASEYRERNFLHLSAVYDLITTLDSGPTIPTLDHTRRSRSFVNTARAQAQWCLDVLSEFEKQLFRFVGASRALEVCEQDLEITASALNLIDQIERSYSENGSGPTFAEGLRLRDHAQAMLADSQAFHPYVSLIEDKVERIVRIGTAIAAIGLTLVFGLLACDLARAQRVQSNQTRELKKLALIAERVSDSIVVTNRDGRISWVNPAFETLSGYTLKEAIGRTPGSFLQGLGTSDETRREIRQALVNQAPIRTNILNYAKDGSAYWINLSISPLLENDAALSGFVAISVDITQERENQLSLERANEQVVHQARHDPLTDLPNRRYIDEVIASEVSNEDQPRTLIRIDLDYFKNVNDTLGHAAGDHVLRQVAEIIRSNTRAADLSARVGGDEFVILLAKGTAVEDAVHVTERLRKEIQKDMPFDGQSCRVGASFGVATATEGFIRNSDLLKSADAALYLAKERGRNTTSLYTPEVHSSVLEKRHLSVEIERGIENAEFEPYFQPQFTAETEVLIGVEALARWRHPERGILPPNAFLPVAEQLRLVPEIDRLIFAAGLDRAAELNAEGLFIPKIAFNVGLTQLMNPELPDIVAGKDIGFTRISLEVLESVLIEEEGSSFLNRVNELRAEDFGIELDDFGSGHASVVALQKLSPEIVKLDRQLVAPIHEDNTARRLISSMIEIGKTLGIGVLAEGVETATHATILRELGCDALQGYYFAKPMPFEELKSFARQGFDESTKKVTSLSVHRDRRVDQ